MKHLALIITSAIALSGCAAESRTTGTTKLSRAIVEKSLVKGETTKDQVRALLGEPKSTSSGDMGIPGMPAETWIYTKTFYRDPSEKGFAYGVAYNMATGSQYDRIEVSVLMVMFDAKGRVSGHTFSTSVAGANQ